jgi:hypothetical protein
MAPEPAADSGRRADGPFSRCTLGGNMSNLVKALIGLSALAFVLAVLTHFVGPLVRTQAAAYSRASADLALLAIALVLTFGGTASAGRSL